MAAAVAMTGCSGGQDLRAAAAAPITVSLATPPRPFLPPSSNSSPPAALASRASAAPTSSRSLDVTQDAAARYVPPVAAESPAPAPTVATGTRYVDPLAVAAGYLRREEFPAIPGDHCKDCPNVSLCPAKGAGSVVTQ